VNAGARGAAGSARTSAASSAAEEVEATTLWCPSQESLLALLSISQELHAGDDLASGLRRFGERLVEVVPFDTLGVLLLDERGREMRYAHSSGIAPEVAEHWRFGMGQGIVGTVAASGKALLVPDVRSDPRYIDAREGIVAELAVPLMSRDRVVGVLDLGSRRAGALTVAHRDLLVVLGNHLASAIERSRLFENTRDQARRLSLLHEVSRELSSILDRRRLLAKVAELLRRLVGYDVISVMLWDPLQHHLEPWLGLYADGSEVGREKPVPLGQGLCGTAAALRQSIRVPNVEVDPRYVRCSYAITVRSELVVPLVFEDRLLGVLDLESSRYDAFSSRDEELVSTLASSVAIALENARLYECLLESERRHERDLETARGIQKQLLPSATVWVPGLQVGVGYEPALHLAGDFYDVLPWGEGKVAIAVGDVAGKATPAALYATLAIGMLREYALHARGTPSVVLADLNDRLRQLQVGNRFLAMVFAIYDSTTRELLVANAGLPPPILVLPGGKAEELALTGVPLGLLPERRYDELRLHLPVGAQLMVATDGLEEATDPQERELGRERLGLAVERLAGGSARDVAQGLLAEVARHRGAAAEPADDATVVVLKGV
jgi:sigma-B regulation protein RsbU (phosphoserine phosphatase)